MNKGESRKIKAPRKRAAAHLMALEPRMMFDGAAVATAAETLPADNAALDASVAERLTRADIYDIHINGDGFVRPGQADRGQPIRSIADRAPDALDAFKLSGRAEERFALTAFEPVPETLAANSFIFIRVFHCFTIAVGNDACEGDWKSVV